MGRYANPTIRFDFPDLSEDDDPIYVVIRNPKRMAAEQLIPKDVTLKDADGNLDEAAVKDATFELLASLVVDWHVYDGAADDDSDPLPLPATAAAFRSLPFEIFDKVSDALTGVVTPPR